MDLNSDLNLYLNLNTVDYFVFRFITSTIF